jgi:hypothetical protein
MKIASKGYLILLGIDKYKNERQYANSLPINCYFGHQHFVHFIFSMRLMITLLKAALQIVPETSFHVLKMIEENEWPFVGLK